MKALCYTLKSETTLRTEGSATVVFTSSPPLSLCSKTLSEKIKHVIILLKTYNFCNGTCSGRQKCRQLLQYPGHYLLVWLNDVSNSLIITCNEAASLVLMRLHLNTAWHSFLGIITSHEAGGARLGFVVRCTRGKLACFLPSCLPANW